MEETKRSNEKARKIAFVCTKYFFLVLVSCIFLFPVYVLLITSIMPDDDITYRALWPTGLNLATYLEFFQSADYLQYILNTLFVSGMTIIGVCFASSLTAYALTKLNFFGRDAVFAMVMAVVLLPGTVLSIPLTIIYRQISWDGTLFPLWVPLWMGGGTMNIFLVRQFMRGIPNSYCEAAKLDGANSFQVYLRVVLPMIKPILIYLAVTTFIGTWNDFQGPLTYVGTKSGAEDKWTLSLALYFKYMNASTAETTKANTQAAVGVIVMLPCLIMFAFFQKSIMEGISSVGVKG
ncbi:MAG: carbohydrate ABC transporter permease [Clostridiales bacterium]|nr:carbohydrate ABC transporter permease [Clostridiales bacterium]